MPIDRTRKFNLPGIQDLNKDQDAALALPIEGQNLVIGGPGTGKSVVALLRARQLGEESQSYKFLVYNHMLDHSNRYLFGDQHILESLTWETWFRQLWQNHTHTSIPTLPVENNGRSYKPIDWTAVLDQVRDATTPIPPIESPPMLIIDEGQDMPPAFYDTLANLGFEHFYVVADQNQQIHPDKCSSRQDIENALGLEPSDTLELKFNYRNPLPIAKLAQHFYPDDPASPKPDLPKRESSAVPELVCYGDESKWSFQDITEHILKLSDRHPSKLIGIITPNNKIRDKFYCGLQEAIPILDNEKPIISTYHTGIKENTVDFSQGGIVVINAQACKGLEFDIVFLADIDQHFSKNDPYVLKARLYVMVTRARERIILLRTGDISPMVEQLLPNSKEILSRK